MASTHSLNDVRYWHIADMRVTDLVKFTLSTGVVLSLENVSCENDKPPTASVAWTPITIPEIRILKIRVASNATPINAASAISEVAMMPKEATPRSSPLGGPRSARARQLRPPTARNPCRVASDH